MQIEEMESLLARLGVRTVGSRGSEVQGFCPGHVQRTGHEDHNPSWYINADTGAHICFSCQFKGSLSFLVCQIQGFIGPDGYDFDRAKEWLNSEADLSESFERATKVATPVFEEVQIITEASLAAFITPPEFALRSRGLTVAAAEKHQLLWDSRRELWIIPIRNPQTGKLLGWQEKAYRGRYFRNYPTGVTKSIALFGFGQYSGGRMIVVESPLDVVRLESVGISGGVSTYGSAISKEQLYALKSADQLVFAMDADDAGTASSIHIFQMSKVFGFECWFFDYADTEAKDVGGMSLKEITDGLENSKHSVRYGSWV